MNEIETMVCELRSLGWRRTNAERRNETAGLSGDLTRNYKNGADNDRDWAVFSFADNPGVSDRANGTLMARKLRFVGVNVNGLDDADECDQQNAHQGQRPDACTSAQHLPGSTQEHPQANRYTNSLSV
jgi:hypothetical protein